MLVGYNAQKERWKVKRLVSKQMQIMSSIAAQADADRGSIATWAYIVRIKPKMSKNAIIKGSLANKCKL